MSNIEKLPNKIMKITPRPKKKFNDRLTFKSSRSCERMFNNLHSNSDFKIEFTVSGRTLKLHKEIMCDNPYFAVICGQEHRFLESSIATLEIKDVEEEDFLTLACQSMYSNIHFDKSIVADLYIVANKYEFIKLAEFCLQECFAIYKNSKPWIKLLNMYYEKEHRNEIMLRVERYLSSHFYTLRETFFTDICELKPYPFVFVFRLLGENHLKKCDWFDGYQLMALYAKKLEDTYKQERIFIVLNYLSSDSMKFVNMDACNVKISADSKLSPFFLLSGVSWEIELLNTDEKVTLILHQKTNSNISQPSVTLKYFTFEESKSENPVWSTKLRDKNSISGSCKYLDTISHEDEIVGKSFVFEFQGPIDKYIDVRAENPSISVNIDIKKEDDEESEEESIA